MDKYSKWRDTSLFGAAFMLSFGQNALLSKILLRKEGPRNRRPLSSTAERKLQKACEEAWDDEDYTLKEYKKKVKECVAERDIGGFEKYQSPNFTSTRTFQFVYANLPSLIYIGGGMAGLYYLWDWEMKRGSAKTKLATAISYGIVCWLLHTIISSAGKSENYVEIGTYSVTFALGAAGLSAIMHEFY